MQVDQATHARYVKNAPELLEAVTGETDHYIMRRDAISDYCVKFNGGLCGTQQQYGSDFLSDACHFYPRVTRQLAEVTLMTATLSCPEIARNALFAEDAFAESNKQVERLPGSLHDYVPDGITGAQAFAIHHLFLDAVKDETVSPERCLMHLFTVAESLTRISVDSWAEAIPFYLQQASASLPAPEPRDTDPAYLLQSLCGLVAAAKKLRDTRLTQTIQEMERALHITIPWDTLTITPLPDSIHATQTLYMRWEKEWKPLYALVLRRYLMMQLSLALFPFAGFGETLTQRIAIIGVRFALVKLGIMAACAAATVPLAQNEIVRVVQSLSRFLDHLADPEFSVKIYQETGWLQKRRLRALIGDKD